MLLQSSKSIKAYFKECGDFTDGDVEALEEFEHDAALVVGHLSLRLRQLFLVVGHNDHVNQVLQGCAHK